MLRPSCGCGSFFSARCDAVSGCFPHFISSPACISAVKVSSAHIPAAGSPVHPPFARKSRLPFAAGIFSLATCRQLFYSRHVIAGRECLKSSQPPRPLVSDASPAGGCGDSYIPQPHDHGAPPSRSGQDSVTQNGPTAFSRFFIVFSGLREIVPCGHSVPSQRRSDTPYILERNGVLQKTGAAP